jgi:hypothetical protein
MPGFTATIVDCINRHAPRAAGLVCKVVDFDPRWIVVLDVTSADEDSPIQPGRANLLIHSPAQTFHTSAEEVAGSSYRFELSPQSNGWWLDRATPVR